MASSVSVPCLAPEFVTCVVSRSAGPARAQPFAHGLRRMCERAGVPYRSPHKLRHSHAVYALERCDTVADLKAVSQNLMHESLVTTHSIYSVLQGTSVGQRIAQLGEAGGEAGRRPLRMRASRRSLSSCGPYKLDTIFCRSFAFMTEESGRRDLNPGSLQPGD